NLFFQVLSPVNLAKLSQAETANYNFARRVIAGIAENLSNIDECVTAASTHWSLARMSRVDRNILRLAAYELQYEEDIPQNVTINEAIEVAKRFGADDSPTFVNGVLDKIACDLRKQASQNELKQAKVAAG
ncbi:MAG: transcription antitermination factor NusB, partial [Bdellovibrionales bacterium]|nr:transcription antitermination factor NusB [Bdellovibrionales bacterium]